MGPVGKPQSSQIMILIYCQQASIKNQKLNAHIFRDKYGRRAVWKTARNVTLSPGVTYKMLACVRNFIEMGDPDLVLSRVKILGQIED